MNRSEPVGVALLGLAVEWLSAARWFLDRDCERGALRCWRRAVQCVLAYQFEELAGLV